MKLNEHRTNYERTLPPLQRVHGALRTGIGRRLSPAAPTIPPAEDSGYDAGEWEWKQMMEAYGAGRAYERAIQEARFGEVRGNNGADWAQGLRK